MKQVWLILVVEATCRAALPMIGDIDVFRGANGPGAQRTNPAPLPSAMAVGDKHPVINEVLPRNESLSERQFLDEEWLKQGWIELYNPFDEPLHLANYFLSDSADAPQKWAFPDVSIKPRGFLRVWTSGKDHRDPGKDLHASFNLMAGPGVFLTYAAPEQRIDVLEALRVPADYSYGRYPDGAGAWYFCTRPTPGAANTPDNRQRFVIDQRHVSLTVGTRVQLTVTPPGEAVIWRSDNPLVSVDPAGGLLAARDAEREDVQAIVTASSLSGDQVDSCRVTIVNWAANLSELKVVANPYASYILATEGDRVFYIKGQDLCATSDGFETSQFLAALPEGPNLPKMQATLSGYFLQCEKTIFRSHDLVNWTPSTTMNMRGLLQGLAYYWEPRSQTGYLYAGEYSCDPNNRHTVRRGVFPPTGGETWETILDFASLAAWGKNPALPDAARHVHTVAVDPYTGDVWVATGDADEHSRLLCSHDNGESFRLVGMGNQVWRCLSIWFTDRYVYWAMDAYSKQCCWRIARARVNGMGLWPCLTPEVTSGTTRPGVSYFVVASQTAAYFPVPVGRIYKETQMRPLSAANIVRALDDPEYDYRERVADLCNGSLWYHLWVRDDQGDPILVLGQSAEGAQRDFRGRVFGLKELPDGRVDVQELLSVASSDPDTYDANTMFVQLEPRAQDAQGHVYFTGRWTNRKTYKTKLVWADNPSLR